MKNEPWLPLRRELCFLRFFWEGKAGFAEKMNQKFNLFCDKIPKKGGGKEPPAAFFYGQGKEKIYDCYKAF